MATKEKQKGQSSSQPASTSAEPSASSSAAAPSGQDVVFQIQRVYLKELSLEQPNSPHILLETEQPTLDVQLNIAPSVVVESIYEVSLTATVQTRIKDKTVFLVEVTQSGIFEIRNFPADQILPILGITCAQIVYPYLRASVADVVVRAGFAPVHLNEINFAAMFEAQQAQLAQTLNSTRAANDAGLGSLDSSQSAKK